MFSFCLLEHKTVLKNCNKKGIKTVLGVWVLAFVY